jgi:anaerobic glycerol-3-phosphate dehydrogenase
LWREALLAQKVLAGATRGYRHHPQLDRFRQSRNPTRAIAIYLWSVADEAKQRGYHFDVSKIAAPRGMVTIPVTKGQLAYELTHLKQKLRQRDPNRLQLISRRGPVKVNPTFKAMEGPMAPWERTPKGRARRRANESRTRAGSSNG